MKWGIVGQFGIYAGWAHTRAAAIAAHVAYWRRENQSPAKVWRRLKRNGDRAVRIKIAY